MFDRPEWLAAAQAAFQFVTANMGQTDDGSARLSHAWRNGAAKHVATLDDYTNMCRGGLLLFETTQVLEYTSIIQSWVDAANRYYWDENGADH